MTDLNFLTDFWEITMGYVLGFGSTEEAVENALGDAFEAFVAEEFGRQEQSYFSDAFVRMVEDWARKRGSESQAEAKKYDKAETFPDRYSSFYASVADSASHIVLIAKFHHINRRHALSPDGWGLMVNTRLFHVDVSDLRQREQSAA